MNQMNFGIRISKGDGVFGWGMKMHLLQFILDVFVNDIKVFTCIPCVRKIDFKCMVISKLRPLPTTTIFLGEGGILESAILSNG